MQFTELCRWASEGSSNITCSKLSIASAGFVVQSCGQLMSMAAGCCTANLLDKCTGHHTSLLLELILSLCCFGWMWFNAGRHESSCAGSTMESVKFNGVSTTRRPNADGKYDDRWRVDCRSMAGWLLADVSSLWFFTITFRNPWFKEVAHEKPLFLDRISSLTPASIASINSEFRGRGNWRPLI